MDRQQSRRQFLEFIGLSLPGTVVAASLGVLFGRESVEDSAKGPIIVKEGGRLVVQNCTFVTDGKTPAIHVSSPGLADLQ